MRLCRVLQNLQPVLFGHRIQRVHVGRLPVEMHREDGLGAPGDSRGGALGVDVMRVLDCRILY